MLFGGFQSGTSFTHALGLITDVVIDPQSVTNITVTPYAPDIIGDRPWPEILEAGDVLLAEPKAFPEVVGLPESLLQKIPCFRVNVTPDVVPFRIGGGGRKQF